MNNFIDGLEEIIKSLLDNGVGKEMCIEIIEKYIDNLDDGFINDIMVEDMFNKIV